MSDKPKHFEYKQSLGQNFIFDRVFLRSLVDSTPVNEHDTVLEIGAGRGDLSLVLAERCKQLICVEIDPRLEPVLRDNFQDTGNIRLVMADIMKTDLKELMACIPSFHVVSNLPYYLTTPILTRLLLLDSPILSISVMVQAEAAKRLLAPPGTPEYGPLAVLAHLWGTARRAARVPARVFMPPPKVDSEFIVITKREQAVLDQAQMPGLHQLLSAAFAMRRKTLANNLMHAYHLGKEEVEALLASADLPTKGRGEQVQPEQWVALYRLLSAIRVS